MRRRVDTAVALLLAASYPLYIQLDALPRADAVGPPVPDRYAWLVAAALATWLGFRATTLRGAAGLAALLAFASIAAYTDAAAVTGVAVLPLRLSVVASALVLASHVLGIALRRMRRP